MGKLRSLERLDLSGNEPLQLDAPLDFLLEGCPNWREVKMRKWPGQTKWTPTSLAHLAAFAARLRAGDQGARVYLSSH